MAGTGGQPEPDLIQELLRNPEQFDFFQAVRLIERAAAELSRGRGLNRIGGTEGPAGEAVRFHALASLSFWTVAAHAHAEPRHAVAHLPQ